jgi:hypothetical protein
VSREFIRIGRASTAAIAFVVAAFFASLVANGRAVTYQTINFTERTGIIKNLGGRTPDVRPACCPLAPQYRAERPVSVRCREQARYYCRE